MDGEDSRSVRTREFKDQFDRLPARVQKTAISRYKNYFVRDPFHPLLDRHQLHNVDDAPEDSISVEIFYGYRAVGFYDEANRTYVWYWCGSHSKYNTRFREGR